MQLRATILHTPSVAVLVSVLIWSLRRADLDSTRTQHVTEPTTQKICRFAGQLAQSARHYSDDV